MFYVFLFYDWFVQDINDTTIYAGKVFSFNFTEVKKNCFEFAV